MNEFQQKVNLLEKEKKEKKKKKKEKKKKKKKKKNNKKKKKKNPPWNCRASPRIDRATDYNPDQKGDPRQVGPPSTHGLAKKPPKQAHLTSVPKPAAKIHRPEVVPSSLA